MPIKYICYSDAMDDGRRKIHPKDHDKIREDYLELKSQRKTAELWNVSRRTIQFILDPDKLKEFQRKRYLLAPWLEYYDKDKWRESQQRARAKKRDYLAKQKQTQ
jgi:hypothetical protein